MDWFVFLCVAAVTIAIFISVPGASRLSDALARIATNIARQSSLAELIIFLVAFLLAAIPSLIWSVPLPSEPDEFSYLLAADTFAHGRLSNPPHPLADALEFADVLQRPTYASKHPPAQGFALALGQVIAGLPILGVWLTGALACAAITWTMRAVAPSPHWALLAGLLVAMHPLIAWWNQSYWGGNIAMLGGALALGAAFRLIRTSDARITRSAFNALVAGIGLSLLALSRPFEGALLAMIVVVALIRHLRFRTALGALIPMIPTLCFMAYYNSRVTHDWRFFPHRLHQQQYMIAPRFFWERPRPDLQFASRFMRDAAMFDYNEYLQHLGARNFLRMSVRKTIDLTRHYFPPALLLASVLGAVRARDRRTRISLILVLALPAIHLLSIPITRPPYFAPIVAASLVLAIQGLRTLRPGLKPLAVAIVVASLAAAWVRATPQLARRAHEGPAVLQTQKIAELLRQHGKHLVLVRYTGDRPPLYDFVHNGADIDGLRIVFARSLDPPRDRATLDYFSDRTHWLLTYDDQHFSFEPIGANQ